MKFKVNLSYYLKWIIPSLVVAVIILALFGLAGAAGSAVALGLALLFLYQLIKYREGLVFDEQGITCLGKLQADWGAIKKLSIRTRWQAESSATQLGVAVSNPGAEGGLRKAWVMVVETTDKNIKLFLKPQYKITWEDIDELQKFVALKGVEITVTSQVKSKTGGL